MSSRKREGEPSHEGSPEKAASIQPDPHDVVIIVDGHKFYCWKEKLASNSEFFKRMLFGKFSERNEKEVTLRGVVQPGGFQLFLHAVDGIERLEDESIEQCLALAVYLESATFEDACVKFITDWSMKTKKEQFEIGDRHHSKKLSNKLFSTVKNKYELDEIIPSNLETLNSLAKDVVIAKSFQFLGIRQPPSPSVAEDPDKHFKHNLEQLIGQVEVQNFHGELVVDQIALVANDIYLNFYFDTFNPTLPEVIKHDSKYQELLQQSRHAQETIEKIVIEAQIQLIKFKYMYTALENEVDSPNRSLFMGLLTTLLLSFPSIIAKDRRNLSSAKKIFSGSSTFEVLYREAVEKFENRVEPSRNTTNAPRWFQSICSKVEHFNPHMQQIRIGRRDQMMSPESYRRVSNNASFPDLDKLIEFFQDVHYIKSVELRQNRVHDQDGDRLEPVQAGEEDHGRHQDEDQE